MQVGGHILGALGGSGSRAATVRLELETLPPSLRDGGTQTLRVGRTDTNGTTTLTTENGEELQARLNPPQREGTRLRVTLAPERGSPTSDAAARLVQRAQVQAELRTDASTPRSAPSAAGSTANNSAGNTSTPGPASTVSSTISAQQQTAAALSSQTQELNTQLRNQIVALRVFNGAAALPQEGTRLQAQVVSAVLNTLSQPAPPAATAPTALPPGAAPTAQPAQAVQNTPQNTVLRLFLQNIQFAGGAQATVALPAPLPRGSSISLQVQTPVQPAAQAAAQPLPAQAAQSSPPALPGANASVRILDVRPPNPALATAQNAAPANAAPAAQQVRLLTPPQTPPVLPQQLRLTPLPALPQAAAPAATAGPALAAALSQAAQNLPEGAVLVPLERPAPGQTLPAPATAAASGTPNSAQGAPPRNLFTYLLNLPNGQRFALHSSVQPAENSAIAIRFTPDGLAEVLRIVEPTPVGRQPQQQQGTPGQPQAAATRFTPGQSITATVTAQTARNTYTLTLPDGKTFNVEARQPLKPSTQVNLVITAEGEAQLIVVTPASALVNTTAQQVGAFSSRWDGLFAALRALRSSAPQGFAQLQQAIPHIGKGFLPGLMKFMDAVNMQDISRLLGDDLATLLRNAGIDLGGDMSALQQLQQKQDAPENWRTLFFPYVEEDGGDPQQGAFYWRQQENEDGTHSTRLVVELALSALGPLQLDTLIRENSVYFKLRMQHPPAESITRELPQVVREMLRTFNIQGDLSVEHVTRFPLDPLHEKLEQSGHSDIVA